MSSHSSETPDAYILPGAEAGFRAAAEAPGADEPLADLYLRNAGWAYNLCYRTSLDRDEAARMLADGFAVAVRRYPEAQASKRTFASLLLTALGGPALDAGSRQVRERTDGPIDPEPPEAAIDTAAAIRDADRQLLVRSAVARLPVRQRKLLALHVGARIDMEAMADALGEHPAPVAGSLARAELALARELRPAAWWRSGVLADCAAALPTLARPDAGEPPHPPRGVAAHADGCERCAANAAAMAAARRDYAAWLALAPPPWRQTEAQLPQTGSEALARSLQLLQARGIRRLGVAATVSASALLIAMTAALSPSLRDRPEPAPAGAAVATAATGGTPAAAAQALTIPGPQGLRDHALALGGNSDPSTVADRGGPPAAPRPVTGAPTERRSPSSGTPARPFDPGPAPTTDRPATQTERPGPIELSAPPASTDPDFPDPGSEAAPGLPEPPPRSGPTIPAVPQPARPPEAGGSADTP